MIKYVFSCVQGWEAEKHAEKKTKPEFQHMLDKIPYINEDEKNDIIEFVYMQKPEYVNRLFDSIVSYHESYCRAR